MQNQELYSPARLRGLNQRLEPGVLDTHNPVLPGGIGGAGSRAQVIAGLESKVSLLQVAEGGLGRVDGWLGEVSRFLNESSGGNESPLAPTVANRFIEDRLRQIQMITGAVSFGGQALLNGQAGVLGKADGQGLQFVKGSARTQSSEGRGYSVMIERGAQPASLMGTAPLLPTEIKKEGWIGLKEGQNEARYRVHGDEEPKELADGLQACLDQAGLDIQCYLTGDMRLLFLHNQLGSGPRFEGISQKTRLVSPQAGEVVAAQAGRDINGQIGSEPALGKGGFLIGAKGNQRTDGLILYFDGPVAYPGQIVGYVEVAQKGLLVPMDLGQRSTERLSLPAIGPEMLSVGVKNLSGFKNLAQIRAGSSVERRDALKMVLHAQQELESLGEELKWKEEVYVAKAIDLLKQGVTAPSDQADLLGLSQDKAKLMASQLRGLLDVGMG